MSNATNNTQVDTNLMLVSELIEAIWNWGNARNITREGGATVVSQISKGAEEVIELAVAHCKYNREGEIDGVGDIIVCILSAMRVADPDNLQVATALVTAPISKYAPAEMINSVKVFEEINGNLVMCLDSWGPGINLKYVAKTLDLLKQYADTEYISIHECLVKAWDEIKDRKGTMIEGKFVKAEAQGE